MVILMSRFIEQATSFSKTSQGSLAQQQKEFTMNTSRIHISGFGWVMISMLFGLGVINFADKALLGLAAVPIIKELHLSPTQYGLVSSSLFWFFALSSVIVTAWSDRIGTKKVLALLATSWAIIQFTTVFVFSFPALLLTRVALGAGEGPSNGTSVSAATPWLPANSRAFGLAVVSFGSTVGPAIFAPPLTFLIIVVGWRSAFVLLGVIGLLWVILWLLVGQEHPEVRHMRKLETLEKHPRPRWSEIRPILFSRTVLFSTLAAFVSYWVVALYISWNPVYLVTVRHLRLSDPLYLVGITLPYVVGGIALMAFGAFADRVFRRTVNRRRSCVYPIAAILFVSALCLYLAVSVPSALGSVIFFTLVLVGVTFPLLSTIITEVAPAAYRGAVLGTYVAISTLPGLIAPLVTGLIIQAAGKNEMSGFYHAYMLASLLLVIGGIAFLAFARPDGEHLIIEKVPRGATHVHS
jgi:MFS transporter, ACS family, hexuronate transporter